MHARNTHTHTHARAHTHKQTHTHTHTNTHKHTESWCCSVRKLTPVRVSQNRIVWSYPAVTRNTLLCCAAMIDDAGWDILAAWWRVEKAAIGVVSQQRTEEKGENAPLSASLRSPVYSTRVLEVAHRERDGRRIEGESRR